MHQVITRQARQQSELGPAECLRQIATQPMMSDVTEMKSKRLAAINEPEPDIDQAHHQEKTRPTLPAWDYPTVPRAASSRSGYTKRSGRQPRIPGARAPYAKTGLKIAEQVQE